MLVKIIRSCSLKKIYHTKFQIFTAQNTKQIKFVIHKNYKTYFTKNILLHSKIIYLFCKSKEYRYVDKNQNQNSRHSWTQENTQDKTFEKRAFLLKGRQLVSLNLHFSLFQWCLFRSQIGLWNFGISFHSILGAKYTVNLSSPTDKKKRLLVQKKPVSTVELPDQIRAK